MTAGGAEYGGKGAGYDDDDYDEGVQGATTRGCGYEDDDDEDFDRGGTRDSIGMKAPR